MKFISNTYINILLYRVIVLVSTFSFRKEISSFLFPEKFNPSLVTRKSKPIYSSTMGDEACVFFCLLAVAGSAQFSLSVSEG
jgi:hypothetical protein